MVVGSRVRERERERKKKARGAEMMMVVDRGGSLGEGPCHRLFWRLRLRLPGGVCGVRCAVCHIQCATFAQDYLLSLLSPNNFSLLTNSLLTNSMLHTHTHSLPSHVTLTASPATSPACLPRIMGACPVLYLLLYLTTIPNFNNGHLKDSCVFYYIVVVCVTLFVL